MVLEWDPVELATADIIALSLYRNGQKAGNIPRPQQMHSTKISGLAVDTEYTFHLVLRTSAGTYTSDKLAVNTHKMTDLSGITIATGIMPTSTRDNLTQAIERIGAKLVDSVRIDTTHFVTTEGRGPAWEKAVESNIPVVRPEWVEACEKNGRILGVTKFYLDAMRPGPPSEEAVAASPHPQKSLPPAPAPDKEEEPPESKENTNQNSSDNSEEEKESALEQKARSPRPTEEQKVRREDLGEQKLAIRSNPSVNKVNEKHESGSGDAGSEGDADGTTNGQGEMAATPDRAPSFQEVEL